LRSPFRAITETADTKADSDQLAMARLRHSLVAVLAGDRDLLDVACGSGYALPLIALHARSVTGCDRDPTNIRDARKALPEASFFISDAENLPFPENSFDVVACLEAIYYFQNWQPFVHDMGRLLRPGGILVTSWPNAARPAFNPSPSSTVYPSAEEMAAVADEAGFTGACYGAFPLDDLMTARRPWLDAVRSAVIRLGLIPHSLRFRMLIKRVLYRRLKPLSEISLTAEPFEQMVKLGPGMAERFTMLYFVGTLRSEVEQ
jgi:SAM-dependent methyltransferase